MSRALLLACTSLVGVACITSSHAQDAAVELPPIIIDGSTSLTVPSEQEARDVIQRTPGSVAVISGESFQRSTPARTIKDVLDYVPGVFAQPKWGDDTRLSIRGSGLSRNFHLRGVQLYMDGIPINTADGYGDFQEIDPSAYRYVEVFKGANALRFGANSMGGAINFVTPSGRDASPIQGSIDVGGFGFRRVQASSGGANERLDAFFTGSWQAEDGFRDHSAGTAARGSANIGFLITPDIETRFYLNANTVRQDIPGSVTKAAALTQPRNAALGNVLNDQQRNIDTVRFANKTTVKLDNTTLEFGAFALERHLMHPIFQWLDYNYSDQGGFGRVVDERALMGHANRLTAGFNIHGGTIDAKQYDNIGGAKGTLRSFSDDRSLNVSGYAENAFYVVPSVAVIAGTQYLFATRDRDDKFLANGDQSGRREFNLWSPKVGLLWDIDPAWQAFANLSRSAEVPSFGENSFATPASFVVEEQTATTLEVGTRGRREGYTWDIAAYRANIDNELQCMLAAPGSCTVVNADKTVHQGLEVGFGVSLLKGIMARGETPDRLWLNAAYTLSDFRYDNDAVFSDNELPGAPRHFLRAELLYKHPNGFYAGPNVEWVPQSYYVDSANTQKTEAYALLGVKAGYDKGEHLSAYVEARNLTDEKYIASTSITNVAAANSALYEPGAGRAVYAGIKYRW